MLVDVGICAFRRIGVLDTLDSVANQRLPEGTRLRVIVAENDDEPALRDRIMEHAETIGIGLCYVHAPSRNISIARNACLDAAEGAVLIYIDDDEIAEPDWIAGLLAKWREARAGVVFGPVKATYPPSAPDWMQHNDFHSAYPVRNRGVVETGYSGNALLDLSDPRIARARFNLSFGRTGGEDVDFFFRLHRAGVVMEASETAVVHEPVVEARMTFKWLLRRHHRTGALYGFCVAPEDKSRRVDVLLGGVVKATYCGLRAAIVAFDKKKSSFWVMRGAFHLGVVSGCLSPVRMETYGSRG